MEWYQERTATMSHSGVFGLQSSGHFRHIPAEKNLGDMLLGGELDAVVHYRSTPQMLHRSSIDLQRHPLVRQLFPDNRAEGLRYYQKTGIFPVNHSPVVRRSIVERD